MLSPEILRQIRRLHFRAQRAVEDLLGGEYRSVFKGAGIAFEEVREYQPGDDVRAIDWNVTARMGHPFIKRYIEERELTVLLAIDWSGSQFFGTGRQEKKDVAAEIAAVLAFSAIANNDRVGLLGFTDQVERFIPPRKGIRHVLRLIREVLCCQPRRRKTSLKAALDFVSRVLHRRAIVFLISDFLNEEFEAPLKRTARIHDLIAVRVVDPREEDLPPAGLLELEDAETGRRLLLNTSNRQVRKGLQEQARMRSEALHRLARTARFDLIDASTDGSHLDALVRFFQQRERRLKRP
jgi:uncharacterized protein (DUF58 family)